MRISILYADWKLLREQADLARESDEDGAYDAYLAVTMRGEDVMDSHSGAYNVMWEGYRLGVGGTEDVDREILSELWEQFNIGDHGGRRIRSMSVGDQVWIDDRKWVCKPIGWERSDEQRG